MLFRPQSRAYAKAYAAACGLLVLALVPPASAQQASGLTAVHRDGQTFLTWTEVPTPNVSYRIYRDTRPIMNANDLQRAKLLATVDDATSFNGRRSLVEQQTRYWVVAPGGTPLTAYDGLFVHTAAASENAAYAVTAVSPNGNENTAVTFGDNSTGTPIVEVPAPPQPVMQASGTRSELWAHWVGSHDTPYQRALSLWPSQGFNFSIETGTAAGPQGLLVRLHQSGSSYDRGWPYNGQLPGDITVLSPDDPIRMAGNSFWFGAHDGFPAQATSANAVGTFTLRRVEWTIDWAVAYLGVAIDIERIYTSGSSMGAVGAMRLVESRPQVFAAALCRIGNYDCSAPDLADPVTVQGLFGGYALNLPCETGLPVYDQLDSAYLATMERGEDWPIIRTIQGKNDTVLGWRSVPPFYAAMTEARRPDAHYFDQRGHSGNGHWTPLEADLVERTFQQRRSEPTLRFVELSLDDDPGDGTPDSGDPVGCLNGYADWNRASVTATRNELEFEVSLRDEGALDDAPASEGVAGLLPRRTGAFRVLPGEWIHYRLREGALLVDEHLIQADEDGLVLTPPTPLTKTLRTARFTHWSPPASPYLFSGNAPRRGDQFQAVIFGQPGDRWMLAYSAQPNSRVTPWGLLQLAQPIEPMGEGEIGPDGFADHRLTVPDVPGQSGRVMYLQAMVNAQLTNMTPVQIQ